MWSTYSTHMDWYMCMYVKHIQRTYAHTYAQNTAECISHMHNVYVTVSECILQCISACILLYFEVTYIHICINFVVFIAPNRPPAAAGRTRIRQNQKLLLCGEALQGHRPRKSCYSQKPGCLWWPCCCVHEGLCRIKKESTLLPQLETLLRENQSEERPKPGNYNTEITYYLSLSFKF